MQDQRVGLQHRHEIQAVAGAVAIIQLHRTQIGQQQHVGGLLAHAEVLAGGGILQRDASRA